MASKYMKRCPQSLAIREMQLKTQRSSRLTSIRAADIKYRDNFKHWIKLDLWWYSCSGCYFGIFLKMKSKLSIQPGNCTLGHFLREMKTCVHTKLSTPLFIVVLCVMAKSWK